MFESRQVNISRNNISRLALVALGTIFVAGLFIIAFDQGHTFSLAFGEQAFTDQYLHELTHDLRHAAGFPCH